MAAHFPKAHTFDRCFRVPRRRGGAGDIHYPRVITRRFASAQPEMFAMGTIELDANARRLKLGVDWLLNLPISRLPGASTAFGNAAGSLSVAADC